MLPSASLRAARAALAALLVALPAAAQPQTRPAASVPAGSWLFTLRPAGGGELVVRLAVEPAGPGRWRAFSRSGAAGELVGWRRATLGRLLGKLPPRGALVRVEEGRVSGAADSAAVQGRLVAASLGTRDLVGTLAGGRIRGELRRADTGAPAGTFEAAPAADSGPVRDYRALARALRSSVAGGIYDPALVERPEWRAFFRRLEERFASAPDDVHAMAAFYALRPRLRMSHLELFRDPRLAALPLDSLLAPSREPDSYVALTFPAPGIARLRVTRWERVTPAVDRAFQRIDSAGAHTLVLDVRGNPGGDVSSMAPAAHLLRDSATVGMFLGKGWYGRHRDRPTAAQLATLPVFSSEGSGSTVLFGVREHGALVGRVPPRAPRFDGRVFLLVDGGSGSASEPLAHLLKSTGRATLVGERTAGAMLAAPPHALGDGWLVVFPEADFFTADGTRLEGNGVKPDVAVPSDSALLFVAGRIREAQPYAGALLRGVALQEASRPAEAARAFEEALGAAPDSVAPLHGMGMAQQQARDWDAAFATWERVLARDAGDLTGLYQTGRTAALSGQRLEHGAAALREYLARPERAGLPRHAAARWRLGMILQARGDREGARREYQDALRLEPDNAEAQAALRALEASGRR